MSELVSGVPPRVAVEESTIEIEGEEERHEVVVEELRVDIDTENDPSAVNMQNPRHTNRSYIKAAYKRATGQGFDTGVLSVHFC